MKLRKTIAFIVSLPLAFSQCFGGTVASGNSGDATLSQSSVGGNLWHSGLLVRPKSLDQKSNEKLFGKDVAIPSGEHVVGLEISFDVVIGITQRSFKDTINFRGTFAPGRHYVANGRQNGGATEIWIADKQNQTLASKVLSIYVGKCTGITIFSCPDPVLNIRSKL